MFYEIQNKKIFNVILIFLFGIHCSYALDLEEQFKDTPLTRIALGSCAKQWEPQPVWTAVARNNPDIFIFLGDAIYGDWHGTKPFVPTTESLKADWQKLAKIPEFASFRSQVPILGVWDNHDYGTHNGGTEFQLKEASKQIYLDFFQEPENSWRRKVPGIFDAKIVGPKGRRVQLILLDTRYFKSPFVNDTRSKAEKAKLGVVGSYLPNNEPSATLLGKAQWQWLEEQLSKPAELRFIISSTQIIADQKSMDEWGVFPLERQKLLKVIKLSHAKGVIFLSGNVHFSELSKITTGRYPLYDFTASGMTHNDNRYANAPNQYRVAGPFTEHNFGLVEIDWNAIPAPLITFRAIGSQNQPGFHYQISLEELQ